MVLKSIFIYLLCINLIAAIIFFRDKRKAIKEKPRTPEFNLHMLELFGGIFAIIFLMFKIRHKNRKFSYFILSFLILLAWLLLISVLFHKF